LLQALASTQGVRLKSDFERHLCDRAGAKATTGYFQKIEDCLVPGVCLTDFETDLRAAAGCELDGKFLAIRSSSALAVNTFASFKNRSSDLLLLDIKGFEGLSFEKQLPTGLAGIPPHLDVWLKRDNIVVAV